MKANAQLIKAVLFDLDGTLLDREHSLLDFVQQQYRRFPAIVGSAPYPVYVMRFIELDARGRVWKDKVYQQLLAEFSLPDDAWPILLEDYVQNFQYYCVGFPGLHNMLQILRAQGYQLGLITNGRTTFQRQTIQALGITDYFATILISEAENIRKPAPEIFQRALSHLGVHAYEAVFVGDDPEADIRGAQKVGMQSIWKPSQLGDASTWADAICEDLGELPMLVQQFAR
ncbi:HAD family hydrolase [soil metagenome]